MYKQISCEVFTCAEMVAHIAAMRQPSGTEAGARNLVAFYDGDEPDVRYLPAPERGADAGYVAAFVQDAAEEIERADRLGWNERIAGESLRIGRRALRHPKGWQVTSYLISS